MSYTPEDQQLTQRLQSELAANLAKLREIAMARIQSNQYTSVHDALCTQVIHDSIDLQLKLGKL